MAQKPDCALIGFIIINSKYDEDWLLGRQSSTADLCLDVSSELRLPSIPICQQFLFVVKKLLVILHSEFIVGTLDDRIHRAGFLAKSTIYTFGHVYVIPSSLSTSIRAWLAFN